MAGTDPTPDLSQVVCPVPREQRPLEQYKELQASWFFVWPHNGTRGLATPLIRAWLIVLPLTMLVASGSVPLRHNLPRLVIAGAVAGLVLPLLLLCFAFA